MTLSREGRAYLRQSLLSFFQPMGKSQSNGTDSCMNDVELFVYHSIKRGLAGVNSLQGPFT